MEYIKIKLLIEIISCTLCDKRAGIPWRWTGVHKGTYFIRSVEHNYI